MAMNRDALKALGERLVKFHKKTGTPVEVVDDVPAMAQMSAKHLGITVDEVKEVTVYIRENLAGYFRNPTYQEEEDEVLRDAKISAV